MAIQAFRGSEEEGSLWQQPGAAKHLRPLRLVLRPLPPALRGQGWIVSLARVAKVVEGRLKEEQETGLEMREGVDLVEMSHRLGLAGQQVRPSPECRWAG